MSSQVQQNAPKEYVVRTPRGIRKKYNMMRFHTALGIDFKTWSNTRMERENNLKEFKNAEDEQPKFGAGSEFGREMREEARRKRYGIRVKKYKVDDQPWLLNVDGKTGKKFKGIREGGVSDNVSWYVFMQAKDGAFEAFPVEEWYNFQPINRYKALSAEEAEKEFERRDKIMNYFSVMYNKKLKKDDEPEEEKTTASKAKSLMLSEMDDWMSDADSNDDEEHDGSDSDAADKKKKKGKKTTKKKKRNQGGKRRKMDDGGTDDDVDEESDDYNEGAEHEYVSEDSSDSDEENDEVARKQLAGVDEGEALKKLLNSDEEDEEKDKEKKKQEEGEKEEQEKEEKEKEKKKKKKKKKDKKDSKKSQDSDGQSSDSSGGDNRKETENESKKNVNALKRKMKDAPNDANDSKRARHGLNAGGASTSAQNVGDTGVSEELIRRYLMRKPMTTTELLQKCHSKKTGLSSEQLVTAIAATLKRLNPVKQTVKGKMYLSIKST